MSWGDVATIVGVAFGMVATIVGAGFTSAAWVVRSINSLGTRLDVTAATHGQKHAANEAEHAEFRTAIGDQGRRLTAVETQVQIGHGCSPA